MCVGFAHERFGAGQARGIGGREIGRKLVGDEAEGDGLGAAVPAAEVYLWAAVSWGQWTVYHRLSAVWKGAPRRIRDLAEAALSIDPATEQHGAYVILGAAYLLWLYQRTMLGQVTNPGSFPAGPFMTLAQAISAAGGFTDGAARNSVLVFHRDGARNVRVARVALDRAITSGKLDADIPLSRFDIVYVPRSTVGNVEVFSRQVLGSLNLGLNTALIGWELFNLERVFPGLRLRATP